jgi:hypothetical protein
MPDRLCHKGNSDDNSTIAARICRVAGRNYLPSAMESMRLMVEGQ